MLKYRRWVLLVLQVQNLARPSFLLPSDGAEMQRNSIEKVDV